MTSSIHVFLQTSPFKEDYYSNSLVIQLPHPTDDSRIISTHAKHAIARLYRPHYEFLKAGVGLLELSEKDHQQGDLFTTGQPKKSDALMITLDKVNQLHGRGTLFLGAEGFDKKWKMRQSYTSPAYTTRWTDIPIIRTG
jgi:DNA polymerase V